MSNIIYHLTAAILLMVDISTSENIYGNPALPGEQLTGATPRIFLMRNFSLPSGNVIRFQLYPTQAHQPVRLQIWRYVGEESYSLIGQTIYVTNTNDSVETVPISNDMMVESGDIPGFTMESHECPIAYVSDPFHPGAQLLSTPIDESASLPTVGEVYHFTAVHFDMKFSIGVAIEPLYHCLTNNGGCSQTCIELGSSAVKCECLDGYSMSKDGRTCFDVDECTQSPCDSSESCINTPGSYTCIAWSSSPYASAYSAPLAELENPFLIIVIICWLIINTILVLIALIYLLNKKRHKPSDNTIVTTERDDVPIVLTDVTAQVAAQEQQQQHAVPAEPTYSHISPQAMARLNSQAEVSSPVRPHPGNPPPYRMDEEEFESVLDGIHENGKPPLPEDNNNV